jgi:striatin 1/3/4
MDATIKIWTLPPLNRPSFSAHGAYSINLDSKACVSTLVGHSDAVWQIELSSLHSMLVSASADGSLKLWDLSKRGLKATYWYDALGSGDDLQTPTSVCWSENSEGFSAAYRNGAVKYFDATTGQSNVILASPAGKFILMSIKCRKHN